MNRGDFSGAQNVHEQVLCIQRRLLGEEHPDTLITMGNLANTLGAQGDLSGARKLLNQVLSTHRRLLGEKHPTTSISAWNLFTVLFGLRDFPAGRALLERDLFWLIDHNPATLHAWQREIRTNLIHSR